LLWDDNLVSLLDQLLLLHLLLGQLLLLEGGDWGLLLNWDNMLLLWDLYLLSLSESHLLLLLLLNQLLLLGQDLLILESLLLLSLLVLRLDKSLLVELLLELNLLNWRGNTAAERRSGHGLELRLRTGWHGELKVGGLGVASDRLECLTVQQLRVDICEKKQIKFIKSLLKNRKR
jgi:hypothetical protein